MKSKPRVKKIVGHAGKRLNPLYMIIFAVLFGGIGTYIIRSSFAATVQTCTSVTQYSVTYTFDRAYSCGAFANGDYWVAPDNSGGTVVITSMTPNYSGGHNGWQVNPTATGKQSFETAAGSFQAPPSLPYTAHGNESIVKAVSLSSPPSSCPNNDNCLKSAVVLTVLDTPPPDDTGAGYIRPPYVGTFKPLYAVSSLQTNLIPSKAPPSGYTPPSISSVNSEVNRLQLDHLGGELGRVIHPKDNLPDYGSTIAVNINDSITRLVFNDSLSAKMPLIISAVQGGLDRYSAALSGQRWGGGGGYVPGKRVSMAFAALMLNDQTMKNNLMNWTFESDDSGVHLGRDGVTPLYGGFEYNNPSSLNISEYWSYTTQSTTNYLEYMDPYGYIDGGANRNGPDTYQFCCLSQPWKGEALAMLMMPGLQSFWPNASVFIAYIDRWVTKGYHFLPDPCALSATNSTTCNAGSGRFPSYDGDSPDGGYYRSDIVDRAWSAFRASISNPTDTTPPDTNITAQPADGTTSTSASFSFTSTESGSTFECKLDSGSYGACTSPKSYTGLAVSSHTFSVRATDGSGNTDASPDTYTWNIVASGTAPTSTTLPTISGTQRVSSSLSVSNGTWNGTTPITYTYQWQRCDSSGANCANISNATNNSFSLTCADYKKTLRVNVKATNSAGNTTATTSTTTTIAKATNAPKGDFNDDCYVNATDVSLFIAKWRASGTTYPTFDVTGPSGTADGYIDSWDLTALISGYGYSG